MSDNTQIERFNWVQNYIVQPTDLTNLESDIYGSIGNLGGAFGKQAILRGFGVSGAAASLNINVGAGSCISANGQISAVSGTTALSVLAPTGGNPCASLIICRPSLVPTNYIPDPNNLLGPQIPLNELLVGTPMVLNGVSAASPSYPATLANDVVLMGLQIPNGATGFSSITYDPTVRQNPGRLPIPLTAVSGNYQALNEDRFIECNVNAASGTVTLPIASMVSGALLNILKSDASANQLLVAPNGSDLINNSSSAVTLLFQNDSIGLISDANQWRKISDTRRARQSLVISGSTSTFSTQSGSFVDATVSYTITTAGKLVKLYLTPDLSANVSAITISKANDTGGTFGFAYKFFRGVTALQQVDVISETVGGSSSIARLQYPPSFIAFIDNPPAGTYTYTLQVGVSNGSSDTLSLGYCSLIAEETI